MSDADKPASRRAVGKRRKAREVALQFLYQLDLNGDANPIPHDEEFWARHPVDDDTRIFGDGLVRGVKSNQEKIDHAISQFAEHWDLSQPVACLVVVSGSLEKARRLRRLAR